MKATLLIFLTVLVCFSSCNKDKDKKFDVVLEHRFSVKVDFADTDFTWQATELLDAATASEDFARYRTGIKNVKVNGAYFEIQNVTTPDVKFKTGTIAYSSPSQVDFDKTTQAANLGMDDTTVKAVEGHEQKLQFSDVSLLEMGNFLTSAKQVTVYLNGVMPATPAKFDVVMRIKATVTAADL